MLEEDSVATRLARVNDVIHIEDLKFHKTKSGNDIVLGSGAYGRVGSLPSPSLFCM